MKVIHNGMLFAAAISLAGCVSSQSDQRFDNIAYGVSLVERINTPAALERVRTCAYDRRIRQAAKERLDNLPSDTITQRDSELADIAIQLRELPPVPENVAPAQLDDQRKIFAKMRKTDDVAVWNAGVENITDEAILAEIAIEAHKFGEIDGKICQSVLPAGLRAVEKLTKKALIEKVYELARTNEVRDAAKAKR